MTTIRDIAKVLGISDMTVSRAFRENTEISEETRQKVLKKAKALNYRPNILARGLRGARTFLLGLILPDVTLYFYPGVIRGIEGLSTRKNFSVILYNSDDRYEKFASHLQALKDKRVDGIIFVPPRHSVPNNDYIRELHKQGIPFVMVDRYVKQVETDWVATDNVKGGYIATEHLIGLGHRRIGFIGEALCSSVEDRLEGYKKALQNNRIQFDEGLVNVSRLTLKEAGYEGMKRILENKRRPTAVFGVNDLVAIGAYQAIKQEKWTVPEDFSLVGYDDSPLAESFEVGLTSVAQEPYQIGKAAARILIENIENRQQAKPFRQIQLTPKLVGRTSSGRRLEGQR